MNMILYDNFIGSKLINKYSSKEMKENPYRWEKNCIIKKENQILERKIEKLILGTKKITSYFERLVSN